MLGGHVVKTGLAPVLVDLVRRGVVTHVAMNGSAAIHDYEIATPDAETRAGSLSGGNTSGTHRLEGIGAGFVPKICRLDLADEIISAVNRVLRKVDGIDQMLGMKKEEFQMGSRDVPNCP